MESRPYYSLRSGQSSGKATIDLAMLKKLFLNLFTFFRDQQYFEGAFGYECCDRGTVLGTVGQDMESQMFLSLRKEGLLHIPAHRDRPFRRIVTGDSTGS